MNRRLAISVLALVAIAAVAFLGYQVTELRRSVDALKNQVQALQKRKIAVLVRNKLDEPETEQNVYKLLETGLGIPLDVERAMMSDPMRFQNPMRQLPSQTEIEGRSIKDAFPDATKFDLDIPID